MQICLSGMIHLKWICQKWCQRKVKSREWLLVRYLLIISYHQYFWHGLLPALLDVSQSIPEACFNPFTWQILNHSQTFSARQSDKQPKVCPTTGKAWLWNEALKSESEVPKSLLIGSLDCVVSCRPTGSDRLTLTMLWFSTVTSDFDEIAWNYTMHDWIIYTWIQLFLVHGFLSIGE